MNPKLLLCLALVLSGLSSGRFNIACAGELSRDTQTVIAGNTGFAVDLYGKLRPREGNVFFSPYSISTALAMTYGGARGETAGQMAQTLDFNLLADKLPPVFAALEANLDTVQKKGQINLAVANSLWPQKDFSFLTDYLSLCQQDYGTTITPVDYKGNTEAARKTINDWVEARTNRKIVELLKPRIVDGSTRLVLVNAIYFKGNWVSQFETNLTVNQPFRVSSDKTLDAPLMRQIHDFPYAEFPDLQVLELPYAGDDLSMLVLLPRKVDGLGNLEARLTEENLAAWTANLESKKVQVFLPKFKSTSEFSLAETLKSLGMTDAFIYGQADFSGMDGRKDLFIGAVVHKAFVEVNEEGTEAAAATAVLMGFGGAPTNPRPIPVVRADHPFLFLIRDNRSGSVLFLGRVMDPTK